MTFDTAHPSIVVIRHGLTDWNAARKIQGRTEVPLNETGRAQAAEAAAALEGTGPWHRVIASPLGRATETARIIATTLGLAEPSIDAELVERDFGPAEGVLVPDAEVRWPGLEIPGAEPLSSLTQRGVQALTRIVREQPGSIVVAHGALLRSALSELAGASLPRIINGEPWLVESVAGGASLRSGYAVRRLTR